MLNIQIKASQISNLTDARYFSAMGVNWLEFSLDQGSEDYIEPNALLAIKEWVEGPKFVGRLGLHSLEAVNEAIKLFSFDAVLLPSFFPREEINKISNAIVIQEFVVEKGEKESLHTSINDRKAAVQHMQLNFEKNGYSWSDILDNKTPLSLLDLIELDKSVDLFIILDSLNEKDLESINSSLPGCVLCLKGGEEEKVGYKSFDELDELFDKMESLSE